MALTRKSKISLFALIAVIIFGYLYFFEGFGKKAEESVLVDKGNIANAPAQQRNANVAKVPLPSNSPANVNSPEIRLLHYTWNTHMAVIYANGGAVTTRGSLMEKYGVNLKLAKQDKNEILIGELVKFANELQYNPQPTQGVPFFTFMGDAGAYFMKPLYDQLSKLGPDYLPVIVGSFGKSHGEDKFMGQLAWKNNPQLARGALIAGVVKDGDWNIAIQWASDNDIPVNPSDKTYDPDALNFLNTADYLDAADKYIFGYHEERPVVKNGKLTGEKKDVAVNGVVTWTPGDENVASKKGGLVSIVSTREYGGQMPNVIVGIKKWVMENEQLVANMLKAAFAGSDQINNFSDAMQKAGELSDRIYAEGRGADYWVRFYKGATITDKQGLSVEIGGSRTHNLADNVIWFGLSGGVNMYKATYERFGNIVKKMYPNDLPDYPKVEDVLYTGCLKRLQSEAGSSLDLTSALPKYSSGGVSEQVGKRSWDIQFNTGQATFTASARKTLSELVQSLSISMGSKVEIHGHTDDTGTPEGNQVLSQKRAQAVADYLYNASSQIFGSDRVKVYWHGQDSPKANNLTEDGRRQNRRVEIVIGR